MTRYAFVQNVGTRITRIGLCKIPEHVRWRRRPTNAILVKSQRAGEVVKFGETSQVRDVSRNRPDGVVREVVGNRENPLLDQEMSNLRFHFPGALYLVVEGSKHL